jgi:hypothetical protein
VAVDELWGRLLGSRTVVGVRDGALWAAAHFYCDVSDADHVLSLL